MLKQTLIELKEEHKSKNRTHVLVDTRPSATLVYLVEAEPNGFFRYANDVTMNTISHTERDLILSPKMRDNYHTEGIELAQELYKDLITGVQYENKYSWSTKPRGSNATSRKIRR